MKNKVFPYVIALVCIAIYAYVQLPVLKLDFASFYSVAVVFFILVGILSMQSSKFLSPSRFTKIHFGIAAFLGIFVLIIPFISSTAFLHSKSYHTLLGNVTESEFNKDLSPVSVDDIRLVDQETALRLGDKKIGEIPGLGSVAKLGNFHIQNVDGKLYWVAPVVHRDVVKWITNLKGTTGYIMVSAINPQEVRFVKEQNGKPIQLVYQPDAYFHQDLARHLYTHGLFNIGLTDFSFEIDDQGTLYWVTTLYEHKIGFSGSDAVGVATVDAQTGEVKKYTIENAPSWIDRIQPESFITNQITHWGTYVNGYLNAMIAEKDVLVPTPGTSLVYGNDNRSYWYTGITSSGADESTIGFMLVDTRTKEAKLYKQPGATELAAMRSAEGKVQEKGYVATFPVMYNILGTPTYVMALKDNAGLIKMVAFVSVEDYSLLGLGDTKESALRNYKETLKSKGNDIQINNNVQQKNIAGKIVRISADVQSGNTYYYFTLDTEPTAIFTATSSVSQELPLTNIGDSVSIGYEKYGDGSIDILTFDNTLLSFQ